MTRRVALLPISNDAIDVMVSSLPHNIRVVTKIELFDRAVSVIKLEGDGLPEWCEEPPNGGEFIKVAVHNNNDGTWQLIPQTAIPDDNDTKYERFINQFVTLN